MSILGTQKRLSEESEKESIDEVWRSCARDSVEADESYFVLNPTADRQPVKIFDSV